MGDLLKDAGWFDRKEGFDLFITIAMILLCHAQKISFRKHRNSLIFNFLKLNSSEINVYICVLFGSQGAMGLFLIDFINGKPILVG